MKMDHMREHVRWDVFEDNLIIFILEYINFTPHDLINKINWKILFQSLMDYCAS